MPTTVKRLFIELSINNIHQVKWGTSFNERGEGIYIVSTSKDPSNHLVLSPSPAFDENQISLWISKLPNFKIDGIKVNSHTLKERLSKFWMPDESILYIGKAPIRKNGTGISKRVTEYFSTEIGDGGPHSGGQWLKTLKNICSFTVYYGLCSNPDKIETQMLDIFMSNVSHETTANFYDKEKKLPFSNIRHRGNKNHRLQNQRL